MEELILEKKSNNIGAWIGFILSILYTVSPIDILPDVIPVVGWLDDLVIAGTGTLNLIQKTCTDGMAWLGYIAKIAKWLLIIVGGILVLLVALLGTVVYSLFAK